MVSVIVPVYNVEKYLEKCLDSIVNQTLKDIEIILIDDGSTDNSGIICDNYAKKDNRVVVIHQENQGVSVSRNEGIEMAKGEYISFVDSDDYIEPEMLETMYKKACEEDIDCVVCKFNKISQNESLVFDYKIEYNKLLNKEKINNYISNFYNLVYFGPVWCKLIRKTILNNIRFLSNVNVAEDNLFMLEVFLKVNNLYVIDKPFYNYIVRDNSLTTKKYRDNLIYSYNQVYIKAIQLYDRFNIVDYRFNLLHLCSVRLLKVLRQEIYNDTSIEKRIEYLKKMRNTEMVDFVFKNKPVLSFPVDKFLDSRIFINKIKNCIIKYHFKNDYIGVFLLKYKQYYFLARIMRNKCKS